MTIDDINKRLDRIRESVGDPEGAHGMRDKLLIDVLDAIAVEDTDEPALLAEAALMVEDIKFERWMA